MAVASHGRRVKLWDLPVRVCHWALVILMPALWWTWKSEQMSLHVWLGNVTLGVVVFRLLWGVLGSSTARFSGFVRGPLRVGRYVRTLFSKQGFSKSGEPVVGHNPLGGWSVVALLALLATEVCLGLFSADTDGLYSGPLNYKVSDDLGQALTHWHGVVFNILLAFIVIHLCAIAFYAVVKRENLVGPMITGARTLPDSATAPRFAPLWRLVVGVLLAMGLMWWVSAGAPSRLSAMTPRALSAAPR